MEPNIRQNYDGKIKYFNEKNQSNVLYDIYNFNSLTPCRETKNGDIIVLKGKHDWNCKCYANS